MSPACRLIPNVGLAVSIAAIAALGCGTEQMVCIQEPVPALKVQVVDAATQANLASIASGTVSGPGASDSLRHSVGGEPPFLYGGYGEEPFAIEVAVAGYTPWSAQGITTTQDADQCPTPFRRTVTAALSRLP